MTKEITTNKDKVIRPPVAVVLGHVDHGKSSLLEAIRDFNITKKESGGITQHIGAYEVEENGRKITFIDTPGHEAFSAMRERGARVADIILLVVDASQSVQPQTKEALAVIKKSGVPFIVVLNKIDLPTADIEKVKRDLAKVDILVESMGGNVPSSNVSAKEKTGIKELLDLILLVADLHSLESDIKSPCEGLVIESFMSKLEGPVCSAIIQKGVLKSKEIIATDSAFAKIRQLKNFEGKQIKEALPSQPVVILGFESVPAVGEKFKTYNSTKEAEEKVKIEKQKRDKISFVKTDPEKKILNIVLKADVFGSLEAIESMLKNLPQEKVILRILKSDVGEISESDVKLAKMSKAEVIGFRVKMSPVVSSIMKADTERTIRIKTFDVIYELVQEVRRSMEKNITLEIVRQDIGKLKTLLVFFGEKNRQIIGGKITEGEFRKGLKLEVIRDSKKIGSGRIVNLQRDKKDISKLTKGSEAGILFEGNVKIEKGDIIVAYIEERQKDTL